MTLRRESGCEYTVETYKVRLGWRLRLRLARGRIRRWWLLRKLTPEARERIREVERAVDHAMFFGTGDVE